MLVPVLLETLKELDRESEISTREWVALKARCYWLAAGFFIWRGRICSNVHESREAEAAGLDYINDTLVCLGLPTSNPIKNIATPHLTAPERKDVHWKVLSVTSLTAFRNEIQASSIVLLTQERFLEANSKVKGDVLSDDERESLYAIGRTLLKRYEAPTDSAESKNVEIIDDFIGIHGNKMLLNASETTDSANSVQSWFDEIVPTAGSDVKFVQTLSNNPCILSILVTCLQTRSDEEHLTVALYIRLIITLGEMCRNNLQIASGDETRDSKMDDSSDSDEESFSSNGGQGSTNGLSSAAGLRLRQYSILIQLLCEKMRCTYKKQVNSLHLPSLMQSGECMKMLQSSLTLCSDWFRYPKAKAGYDTEDREDLKMFGTIHSFWRTIRSGLSLESRRVYIFALMRMIVKQRQIVGSLLDSKSGRAGRFLLQRVVKRRSELLSAVCCSLGHELSTHKCTVDSEGLRPSDIIRESETWQKIKAVLLESLLWLWKVSTLNECQTKERLHVPVAVAMIGLCGSAASFLPKLRHQVPGEDIKLASLVEFFDSDASASAWLSDEENVPGHADLLRVVAQAVHCVDNVFGQVEEKDCVSFNHWVGYTTDYGPLLPLVVSRVLNNFAEILLVQFDAAEDDKTDVEVKKLSSIWSDYHVGTRDTGILLDSLLYKAYKCLHGFTLLSAGDGKESSASTGVPKAQRFKTENVASAAALYRCIMRAYSQGRKSPPKASLDCVLDGQ
jgi:hypothetical protein